MHANAKVAFSEKWHKIVQTSTKIVDFDEKLIARESNCGNFRLSGLGWGPIWDRFFEKMLVRGWGVFSKIIILFANGVGFGKWHFRRESKKVRRWKRRWRNLSLLCDWFKNYFQDSPADFLCREGGLGGYRILFLYIGTPDQPPHGGH